MDEGDFAAFGFAAFGVEEPVVGPAVSESGFEDFELSAFSTFAMLCAFFALAIIFCAAV